MKMKPVHYAVLKKAVEKLAPQIPAYRELLEKGHTVKDKNKRMIWDVFYATKVQDRYSYQEFDYKDSHIETAMRAIFKELNIPLY